MRLIQVGTLKQGFQIAKNDIDQCKLKMAPPLHSMPVLKIKLVLTGLVTSYCLISPTLQTRSLKIKNLNNFRPLPRNDPLCFQKSFSVPKHDSSPPSAFFSSSSQTNSLMLWTFYIATSSVIPRSLDFFVVCFFSMDHNSNDEYKYGTSSALHILWDKRSAGRLRNVCLRQHCQERQRSPL